MPIIYLVPVTVKYLFKRNPTNIYITVITQLIIVNLKCKYHITTNPIRLLTSLKQTRIGRVVRLAAFNYAYFDNEKALIVCDQFAEYRRTYGMVTAIYINAKRSELGLEVYMYVEFGAS